LFRSGDRRLEPHALARTPQPKDPLLIGKAVSPAGGRLASTHSARPTIRNPLLARRVSRSAVGKYYTPPVSSTGR